MGKDKGHCSRSPSRQRNKKKYYRRDSSDGSDSDEPGKKNLSYEDELLKLKEERRKQKELLKATETPEQRRQRRLAKKEEKEKKYNRLKGVNDLGYTNTDNPFGDTKLTENFVWKRKHEQEGIKDAKVIQQKQKNKMNELRSELEKVKKRRQDREQEKAARDEEMTLMQREKEAALFSNWEKQEDEFHLHQARLRSSIRIKNGRAKPIDLLAVYINPEEENLEIQMHEPYAALVGLSIEDLEDLLADIEVYLTIDQEKNKEFWEDITMMVKDELEKLRKMRGEAGSSRRDVINSSVQSDVNSVFKGKTYSQLVALQKQIRTKIKSGGSIDVGYWESLLQQLKAVMAKARLKERHQKMLKGKLQEMKMESTVDDNVELPSEKRYVRQEQRKRKEESETEEPGPSTVRKEETKEKYEDGSDSNENNDGIEEEPEKLEAEIEKFTEAELNDKAMRDYDEHAYSPKMIPFGDVEEEKWIKPEEDNLKLSYLREKVKSGSTVEEELEAQNLFNTEALGEGEETFNNPVALKLQKFSWSDKYRPRKPRFFNRVHTGYEWNKYNQTHYDQDNPPPKIVQGYKFNIFYPDLIDKTKTPEFTLTNCEDDADFAILRFKAGPPYEDIAFKIVDREWECSNRHGFRCQFYNNIFQLYFHFKRYRYRR